MSRRKEPEIPADLLDQLLAGSDAAAALQQGGLLDSLKKALAERALNAEMDHHLGREDRCAEQRTWPGRGSQYLSTSDSRTSRPGSWDPNPFWVRVEWATYSTSVKLVTASSSWASKRVGRR